MFKPQVDAFRGSHRLIRPDLRGNGRSARLVGPIGTILDRQCDDMAALLDHLGIIRVVTIGVSMVHVSTQPSYTEDRIWAASCLR